MRATPTGIICAVEQTGIGIFDLPDGFWQTWLRVFRSQLAMTAPELPWWHVKCIRRSTSATNDAILSSTNWDSLDFGGIEKDLVEKLTRMTMRAFDFLSCINAKTTLKSLKLAGCISITGSGLEPLRGSIILQQIDLSIVGYHESPRLELEPSISEEAVLPILDSVVDVQGTADRLENGDGPVNSLMHVQLPAKWCPVNWREGRSSETLEFFEDYRWLMGRRNLHCSKCDGATLIQMTLSRGK